MAPAPAKERPGNWGSGFNPISSFIQSTTSTLSSFLSPKPPRPPSETTQFTSVVSTVNSSGGTSVPRVFLSLPLANSPVTVPTRDQSSSVIPPDSVANAGNSYDAGYSPPTFNIGRMVSTGKGDGGPAFVGQVFSMCDLTGTGLMAVTSHFDIPFLSKRTPEWMKKMLQGVVKSNNGPVFRFFMDLGDAVAYVKQLNIPSGIVGACRLDLAYEHFKEKPHLFQFIPNEKQVKQANKLLKKIPGSDTRKIDGVPVFSAQNLDIAIATTDGVKWYTPYFFDKSALDSILEESIDQHFNALIQSRQLHRRQDALDDNMPAEVSEETADSMWEPAEVQELLDEVGYPEIPFSVITKVAEVQLMYAVDRLLLGNKWLRKATGIQPKVPYMVDSFQKRSTASLLRASEASNSFSNMESEPYNRYLDDHRSSKPEESGAESPCSPQNDFRFPFGDWGKHPWSNSQREKLNNEHHSNLGSAEQCKKKEIQVSPLLPNITMVGVSTYDPALMTIDTIKKTMRALTKELEQGGRVSSSTNSSSTRPSHEDRDPLFVANVGSYYSGLVKTNPSRWVGS